MSHPEQISDDDVIIRADLADSPTAASVILVEHERWYVGFSGGAQIGPLTWSELLGCVRARTVRFNEYALGEKSGRTIAVRDLFPSLAAAELPEHIIADALQPVGSQFATAPVSYVLFGPQLPPYQKVDPEGLNRQRNLWICGLLASVWLVLILACLIGVVVKRPHFSDGTSIQLAIFSFIFMVGWFGYSAALMEWSWYFETRKRAKHEPGWEINGRATIHC